jgi:hypothetical protein
MEVGDLGNAVAVELLGQTVGGDCDTTHSNLTPSVGESIDRTDEGDETSYSPYQITHLREARTEERSHLKGQRDKCQDYLGDIDSNQDNHHDVHQQQVVDQGGGTDDADDRQKEWQPMEIPPSALKLSNDKEPHVKVRYKDYQG